MPDGYLSRAALDLWKRRFNDWPLYCGDEASVGRLERELWRDWTDRPTTDDQNRIEQYIAPLIKNTDDILHIGIGNSCFATRFSADVRQIVGLTIVENEFQHAESFNIPNYFPMILNKYSTTFSTMFANQFNFIIDNNPASFGCCFAHVYRMMHAYKRFLRFGGQIVTDIEGLRHHSDPDLPQYAINFDDWASIAEALGLKARDVDGSVYIMEW